MLAEIRSRLAFRRRSDRLPDADRRADAVRRRGPAHSPGRAARVEPAGRCYVLDEPTIGLHRTTTASLDTLEALRDKGNTLLVVEHDEDTIRRADRIDRAGRGRLGGRIIAAGHHGALASHPDSLTGRFLANPLAHPLNAPRAVPPEDDGWLVLRGAHLHNLRHVVARIPLRRMTVVTGVSGSGKSTLARDVLLANTAAQVRARNQRKAAPPLAGVERIEGWEGITRVLEVDQTPIGKTPRSCPATYVGFWTRSAGCSPTPARRASAAGARGASASTPAADAARPARTRPADDRDELPAGRQGAVRRLPRTTLQPRDARSPAARPQHRRRWRWTSTRRSTSSRRTRPSPTRCDCCRTSAWAT